MMSRAYLDFHKNKGSLGIYIHIPFCKKKCNYCDFVSYDKNPDSASALPFSMDAKSDYISSLKSELRARRAGCTHEYVVDSIYYGGGTPTTVDIGLFKDLNSDIKSFFSLQDDAEITIEANPETIDENKARQIQTAGFNRISLGVQSLNDDILKRLGRIHHSKKAEESYKILRSVTKNINIDLMFGVPGQTPALWADTLKRALDWEPEHISFYSLQIEEGTEFYKSYREGSIDIPTWEENRRMYRFAVEAVKDAGYNHYEISNAAKPGFECRHNLKYWTMQEYMGLGISAHSYMDAARSANPSDMSSYQNFKAADFPFHEFTEKQNREETVGDFLFTGLRLLRGFSLKDYKSRFGRDFTEEYSAVLDKLTTEGLLEQCGGFIRLSQKGLDYTNPVIEKLLNT